MSLAAIVKLDADLSARLRLAEQPGALHRLAVFFGHSGDSWFWLMGLGLALWLGAEAWKARALTLIVSILVTAVLVMALKFTIRRRRPQGEWGGIYRRTDPHSFPSGHAARAVMLAVMGVGLGPSWFGWLLSVWAPLVGLARVALGVHYLSDVLAGWGLGLVVGLVLLQLQGAVL